MKVILTHTHEIDDKAAALKSISEQIAAGEKLEKNTVGLVFCHYEFVLSGVAEYIAQNLPFPVYGASTVLTGCSTKHKDNDGSVNDHFRLVLTIFSADDVEFTPVLSQVITPETSVDEICDYSFPDIGEQKLGFMMLPHIMLTKPNELLQALTARTKAQIFGGTAVDDSPTYIENCFVIANGKAYRDRAAFLFMKGNINPHFASIVVDKSRFMKYSAVVTESKGREIISLNGRPVIEYLQKFDFNLTDSKADAINGAVMIVDDGDGDTYGRSMMFLTPEKHLFVGGDVPTGAKVSLAMFEKKSVIAASEKITEKMIDAHPGAQLAIISSCESRHILLGSDTFECEKMLRRELGDIPFVFAYAGGEICPSPASTPEKPVNRVFNQSYCICVI
jgi:hypothetical protein